MNDYIFDKDYITNIKKNITNFISRTNINVNKITFNLSLYTRFMVSDKMNTSITVEKPIITNNSIKEASIVIGKKYFNIINNTYYIKEEYEEKLLYKLTKILVNAASLKVVYSNMKPVGIENNIDTTFFDVLSSVIAEDINNYKTPLFTDEHLFNKSIMRMIISLVGYKSAISTYLNHDKNLYVAMYSLSSDKEIFTYINDKMATIERLINTLNNEFAIINDPDLIKRIINLRKQDLLYLIINKLYIPYINSVPLDKRIYMRDEILKGFLGYNYTNLKLNNQNKESYYYASIINNSIPINNKVSDNTWNFFKNQVNDEYSKKEVDIYARYTLYKSKNNIKDFFVIKDSTHIYIDTGKKIIKEKKLVTEMLSYAYITSINDELKGIFENGIVKLCQNTNKFSSKLNGNPLADMMLTAAIIKTAEKHGFNIELDSIKNNIASFIVKK